MEFRRRKRFAFILLIAWILVIPGVMILGINGARTYWDCCWQFYALFLGAEFFDWLFTDTIFIILDCRLPPKAKPFIKGAEHCRAWEHWEWLKTLAIPEHGLLWTLIVCPIAGLAVAGLNMLL